MTKPWSEIRRKHTPEAEEKIHAKVRDAARVMTLHQLREARQLTQVDLARELQINQGAVSTMEKRTDMYVSTLRKTIKAMGGNLRITAEFPEGSVEIDQFESTKREPAA
jgi:transcriptional regulator with XRE-family HTH domain